MKPLRYLPSIALAAVGLAGLCLPVTSFGAGYKLADKAGASIAEFRDEMLDLKKAVDVTMAALDKIVASAATDPRKAFKEFDKSIPAIESADKRTKKRADDMRERGNEYFDKWEQDIGNVKDPEIHKLAAERKAKLQATFAEIKASLEPARDQFTAWLANLKDLQKYLSQDLTIAGIDAAKELIAKSRQAGVEMQQTFDKTIVTVNTAVATITPAKTKK